MADKMNFHTVKKFTWNKDNNSMIHDESVLYNYEVTFPEDPDSRMTVPEDPDNRYYKAILLWIEDGGLVTAGN